MKVASLVLSLIVAAPYGAASAAPAAPTAPAPAAPAPAAPAPPVAAPPVSAPAPVASLPLYGPPPGAEQPTFGPPATASPAQWLGPPSEPRPALPASPAPSAEKSAFVAFSLSFSMPIAAVLAGAYLMPEEVGAFSILAGAVVGPSTGWFYAGRTGRGLLTAATRLAGGLLMLPVLDDSGSSSGEEGTVLLGASMFVAATLVDWIGPAAVVANDNARARATIVPAVQSGGVGLSLVGSF